ncbi:MAG: excinuclease ABC subunit UvrA [Bacteroidales bacterium]|nr:excinuclease ABC subunit UvrA [Bacteroidales bacterium]
MSTEKYIEIQGARVNNLKNVNVRIPRNQLIVITGLSGSGKSSLAFDTLYAEGQRRYVESLSSYARQFLGRIDKPEVDFIKGIPPAIAIEQKVNTRNPRSTVGTSTEIYDYLRMLYARIGKTYSPVSGDLVKKHQVEDVLQFILSFPLDTRFYVLCPVLVPEGRSLSYQLEMLMKQGFNRLEANGVTYRIEDLVSSGNAIDAPTESDVLKACPADALFLLIDRLAVQTDKPTRSRIADSVETAFYEGQNSCYIRMFTPEGETLTYFSKQFEADGLLFDEPTDELFSFNSPAGACPVCEGFGKVIGIDEDLVVPNKSLSIYDEAVFCWRGEKMSEMKDELVRNADKFNFPIFRPWYQLTDAERQLVWTGNKYFHGLNDFFKMLEENQYKIQYRVMLARYRGKTVCPECHGTRLKKQASYVKIGGKSISELVDLPINELKKYFEVLELDETDQVVSKRLLLEIRNRIQFLLDVGLGYLTLNRLSASLSGGESQRINLATSLGSSLVGSLYILDEPSIGLHSRDTQLLIKVLKQLQALGNTVVVVEHDEEIMRAADYIIDMGPDAGRLGGEVVYQGAVSELVHLAETELHAQNEEQSLIDRSYTLKYLTGTEKIPVPHRRRQWNNYIEVLSARQNNLKGVNVKFPLNVLTVVTGVSGSGKSSLVRDIFYSALKRYYGGTADRAGLFGDLKGDMHLATDIEFVDQNPIGKSSRSNPVTYLKAYDEIRKLFSEQTLSRQMGFTPSHFSFNVAGGRCDECQGEGTITVEMQFMADLVLPCEACHGKRFKQDILDVHYREKSISDVLDMTVNQAIQFFGEKTGSTEKKIVKKLKPLQDVGLGYIKLGQSSSTLSGGESQRVKLAFFLSAEHPDPSIYVFDEPTTGLHFHDIRILLEAFNALIAKGHTVIIIEHNMEVIKNADHIIDLGPEGGDMGGNIVFEGTPEGIVKCEESYTGIHLREKL